jgi:VanZ family protein
LLLAVVVAAAIAIHRFNPSHWPPVAVDILHSLHGTGFAVLAVAVYWYLQRRFPTHVNYLLAAVVTLAIGIISEIAQIPGPRDAQLSDLLVDSLGIFGALGVLAAFDGDIRRQLGRVTRVLLPAVAGASLIVACVPSVWLTYALIQQHRTFPQLLTFEHAWEKATFRQTVGSRPSLVTAPKYWIVPGETVAHAKENGRWGIFISLHPKQDWRGYSKLSFVAASVNSGFSMDIGVRDYKKEGESHGVRYYKTVWVDAQPKRFNVTFDEIRSNPEDRVFDFSLVEAVVLSTSKPGSGAEVFVDDFRLEQ